MKVRELIRELNKLPPNAQVLTANHDNSTDEYSNKPSSVYEVPYEEFADFCKYDLSEFAKPYSKHWRR